jgi:Flp pilus assembly pilin Flp
MATMTGMLIGLMQTARRLRGNRDGVGAVEFALIAPVLIILYIGITGNLGGHVSQQETGARLQHRG